MFDLQEECASMMQDLSDKINNKHHEVRTHPLLSIFKMAEVEVKMPYNNEAAISRSSSVLLVVLFAINFFGSTCLFGSWQGHQDITKNLYRVSSLRKIATCRVHVVAAVPTIGGSILMRENSWPWRAQIHEGKKSPPTPRSSCGSIDCRDRSADPHRFPHIPADRGSLTAPLKILLNTYWYLMIFLLYTTSRQGVLESYS